MVLIPQLLHLQWDLYVYVWVCVCVSVTVQWSGIDGVPRDLLDSRPFISGGHANLLTYAIRLVTFPLGGQNLVWLIFTYTTDLGRIGFFARHNR